MVGVKGSPLRITLAVCDVELQGTGFPILVQSHLDHPTPDSPDTSLPDTKSTETEFNYVKNPDTPDTSPPGADSPFG